MGKLVDIKPINLNLKDIKPVKSNLADTKPTNSSMNNQTLDQLYTVTISPGNWLGWFAFTYPVTITGIITSKAGE